MTQQSIENRFQNSSPNGQLKLPLTKGMLEHGFQQQRDFLFSLCPQICEGRSLQQNALHQPGEFLGNSLVAPRQIPVDAPIFKDLE